MFLNRLIIFWVRRKDRQNEEPVDDCWPEPARQALLKFYRENRAYTFKQRFDLMVRTMGESNLYMTYYYPALDDPDDLSRIQTRGEIDQEVLDRTKLRLNEHDWLWHRGLFEVTLC